MSLCLKTYRMICHSSAEIKNLFFNEACVKYIKIMSLCHYV